MIGPEHVRAAERAHLDYDRLFSVRDGRIELDQIALLLEANFHASMAIAKAGAHGVAAQYVEIELHDTAVKGWIEVAS